MTAVEDAQDVGATAGGGGAVASRAVGRPHRGRPTGTTRGVDHADARHPDPARFPVIPNHPSPFHLAVSVFAACALAARKFRAGRRVRRSTAGTGDESARAPAPQ